MSKALVIHISHNGLHAPYWLRVFDYYNLHMTSALICFCLCLITSTLSSRIPPEDFALVNYGSHLLCFGSHIVQLFAVHADDIIRRTRYCLWQPTINCKSRIPVLAEVLMYALEPKTVDTELPVKICPQTCVLLFWGLIHQDTRSRISFSPRIHCLPRLFAWWSQHAAFECCQISA